MRISDKEILLSLHRRLYLLENGPRSLGVESAQVFYQVLRDSDSNRLDEAISLITDEDRSFARKVIESCIEKDITIMTWADPGYPIYYIDDIPPILFLKGFLPNRLRHPYVGIVGARKASQYGKEMTEKIVSDLKKYNVTIVSGLAHGIDTAAHRAALKYDLPTVAILGCGINYGYPVANQGLSREIIKDGAVLSEFPWSSPPLRHHFPLRNRIISSLSRGIIVVEAIINSGSLITARWASEQDKEIFAVPGNAGRIMSSGPNMLIKSGAHLIESGEEVAGILGLQPIENKGEKKNSGQGGPEDAIKRTVVDFLKSGGNNLEKLALETGLSVDRLLPLITEAELIDKLG